MTCRLCEPIEAPNFKPIVDNAIAVFAVYTGATFLFIARNFLIKEERSGNDLLPLWPAWPEEVWRYFVVFAVAALLLRYIIGSAAHLNHVYLPKLKQKKRGKKIIAYGVPKSRNLCWLVFDLFVLILFGLLAVFMTDAKDLQEVMWVAVYFLSAGLGWCLIALIRTDERVIAGKWAILDIAQIGVTLGLIFSPFPDICKGIGLGVFYLLFLFLDLHLVVRMDKLKCSTLSRM